MTQMGARGLERLCMFAAWRVPDGDDPPRVAFRDLRDSLTCPIFEHVKAAFVGTHVRIMRYCKHRSSCYYQRSSSPTFTDYLADMVKSLLAEAPSGPREANRIHS
jgi:hypothetical protein